MILLNHFKFFSKLLVTRAIRELKDCACTVFNILPCISCTPYYVHGNHQNPCGVRIEGGGGEGDYQTVVQCTVPTYQRNKFYSCLFSWKSWLWKKFPGSCSVFLDSRRNQMAIGSFQNSFFVR
jgi:hypothetical protein